MKGKGHITPAETQDITPAETQDTMAGNFDCTRLAERTIHSIFCVEAIPSHQMLENGKTEKAKSKERTDLVKDAVSKKKAELRKDAKLQVAKPQVADRKSEPTDIRNGTGFVIARRGSRLRILTCAHLLDDCYTAGEKLTVDEANVLFHFEVTCAHEEAKVHGQLGDKDITTENRDKAIASCVALDTEKDLMVLQVDKAVSGSRGEGNAIEWLECGESHPPIPMIETTPAKLEPCILQGWPPQSMECNSVGHCSFFNRTYSAVTPLNPKGYTMKLVDLSGMVALSGCSGGPIINGTRDCLGVYHGVIGHVRGYAISASDVRDFLGKFNVLSWPNDDDVQVDAPIPPRADVPTAGQDEQAGVPAAGQGEQAGVPAAGQGEQAGVPAAGQGEQAGVPAAGQGEQAGVPAAGQGGVNTPRSARSQRTRKASVRLTGDEWYRH